MTGSHVEIDWGAVSGATGYEVQVALPNGGLYRDSSVPVTHAVYSPVPTTGTCHYKVSAHNTSGNGPWSAVQTFTVVT